MISVTGLTKVYDQFVAVNDLSFSVEPGQVLGLVGPNGAGKTPTLRSLVGVITPTKGVVTLGGFDLHADPTNAKRTLAFFPDEPRLFEHLTVWQHLNFIARLYQVADYETFGAELLTDLALNDQRNNLPGQLSRGMKQKLVLACGLLHRPKCIVFDEPLTGLDPGGIRTMKATIVKLAADGAAVILSSHLLSLLEEVCTQVLILKNGVKVVDGTLAEIRLKLAETNDASLEDIFFRATEDEAKPPTVTP